VPRSFTAAVGTSVAHHLTSPRRHDSSTTPQVSNLDGVRRNQVPVGFTELGAGGTVRDISHPRDLGVDASGSCSALSVRSPNSNDEPEAPAPGRMCGNTVVATLKG
jgi:hypothetical protein